MSGVKPFETAEGAEYHGCRQLNIFLENRLGQLLRITRLLDGAIVFWTFVEGKVDALSFACWWTTGAATVCVRSRLLHRSEVWWWNCGGKRAIRSLRGADFRRMNINYVYTAWAGESKNRAGDSGR